MDSSRATDAALLRARWFDGRSSQPKPVLVSLQPGAKGPSLHLHPLASAEAAAAPPRVFAPHEVEWPEVWSAQRAQKTVAVDLRDAGSLQIDDGARWHAALAAAGGRPSLAQRMQTRWRVFIVVLLVAAVGLWAFYRYGTPWAAVQLTRHVPLDWETSVSTRALAQLDGQWLKPSKLAPERQAQLRAAFDALAAQVDARRLPYPNYKPRFRLEFRSGLGPNALALPGGTVVMTDALVEAASRAQLDDDALMGVLAHEMGHVLYRHGTRMVVEQGVLNIGLGLAMGDVSSLISTGSALLTGLAYQRGHEADADCFAVALMQQAGRPLAPMAELLLRIDDGAKEKDGSQNMGNKEGEDASFAWSSLLDSHPGTPERARRMKMGLGCDTDR
ncbi:M48 family metallopeptidase [Variovorax sp. LARHSF232]